MVISQLGCRPRLRSSPKQLYFSQLSHCPRCASRSARQKMRGSTLYSPDRILEPRQRIARSVGSNCYKELVRGFFSWKLWLLRCEWLAPLLRRRVLSFARLHPSPEDLNGRRNSARMQPSTGDMLLSIREKARILTYLQLLLIFHCCNIFLFLNPMKWSKERSQKLKKSFCESFLKSIKGFCLEFTHKRERWVKTRLLSTALLWILVEHECDSGPWYGMTIFWVDDGLRHSEV